MYCATNARESKHHVADQFSQSVSDAYGLVTVSHCQVTFDEFDNCQLYLSESDNGREHFDAF